MREEIVQSGFNAQINHTRTQEDDNSWDDNFGPERTALRCYLADLLLRRTCKVEKKAKIFVGLPGSGKTTYANKEKTGYQIIDPDLVKPLLPEYDSGRGAGFVHKESSKIAIWATQMALAKGNNIIIPMVGNNNSLKILKLHSLTRMSMNASNVFKDETAQ